MRVVTLLMVAVRSSSVVMRASGSVSGSVGVGVEGLVLSSSLASIKIRVHTRIGLVHRVRGVRSSSAGGRAGRGDTSVSRVSAVSSMGAMSGMGAVRGVSAMGVGGLVG